jgi:hypothetical protein
LSIPRLRIPPTQLGASLRQVAGLGSDDVELYHRTYSTLLRSSGETLLRVLEPAHRQMNSSLHGLAASPEPDLGAFLYSMRRLPERIYEARVIVMGQDAEVFARHGIGPIDDWSPLEAPARRRRWYDSGDGTLAVLLASASDLDDLIPTLVAYQLEWNKLRQGLRSLDGPPDTPERCAELLGGTEDDWRQLAEIWGEEFQPRLQTIADKRMNLRVRLLGGSNIGYARMTRRWWAPVSEHMRANGLHGRPLYFVSSNTHSIINLLTGTARRRETEIVDWIRRDGPEDLRQELEAFSEGRAEGSWDNFLYFSAKDYFDATPRIHGERTEEEHAVGATHIPSSTAMRVSAQVIDLSRLDPDGLDPRLGDADATKLANCGGVIVNIEYPLGLAAYNIMREITEDSDQLRGVYVLGKAATLNADVGDVMISSVVHDEHSGTTYWLDNAFAFDDIAPYLVFGSGLDNQRAITVRSTFLQNREYLDFYYREAFTVVEMEAAPYCHAIYELSDPDRYPEGEAVNFSRLPIDFGIIHYASDTPYTQARTLGARGLSYYGLDSTYASSVAIVRRILRQEGVIGS